MNQKIKKDDILASVADKTNIPIGDVEKVYDGLVSEIENITLSGDIVVLKGFGTFSLKRHKGHPVQVDFNKKREGGEAKSIPDYIVFKFSSAQGFTERLRAKYAELNAAE
jgi:nucleoid DNA-binding protein